MHYQEVLNYLEERWSFEKTGRISQAAKNFDLDRYRRFLDLLNNPQNDLKVLHVAGSKGKGSTCNFLTSGLVAHGHKVGMFTSPAVYDLREQLVINEEWISETDFVEVAMEVREALESFDEDVSYFEFITSMAFIYFKNQAVDYAVLEVGLGGLFDSTNVVSPLVTVLTQIELEHTNILGSTIDEVLENKLGIMKSSVPMFVSWQIHDLSKQIDAFAEKKNAEVFYMDQKFEYEIKSLDLEGTHFELGDGTRRNLGLIGDAYVKSCLTAFSVLDYLLDDVDAEIFWESAMKLKMSARFEMYSLESGAYLVLDMAHTSESANGLRQTLETVFPDQGFTFLISMLKDKDAAGFLKGLLRAKDTLYITESSIERSLSSEDLAEIAGDFSENVELEKDFSKIFKKLLSNLQSGEVFVVTGSHFLLKDLYSSGALGEMD